MSRGTLGGAGSLPGGAGSSPHRNEYFFVRLSAQTNSIIADASGRGTIVDND